MTEQVRHIGLRRFTYKGIFDGAHRFEDQGQVIEIDEEAFEPGLWKIGDIVSFNFFFDDSNDDQDQEKEK